MKNRVKQTKEWIHWHSNTNGHCSTILGCHGFCWKSTAIWVITSLHTLWHFSFTVSRFFALYFIFYNLIILCLSRLLYYFLFVCFLEFIFCGICGASWIIHFIIFTQFASCTELIIQILVIFQSPYPDFMELQWQEYQTFWYCPTGLCKCIHLLMILEY